MIPLESMIRYEQGDLNETEFLDFFALLIKTGQAWTLQGHYGRTAQGLIENGLITQKGEVVHE